MPKDDQTTDEHTLPTPEELVELRQAKATVDALKNIEFRDGDKVEKFDPLTEEGRKRAAQLGSGGFHVSQSNAELKAQKAELEKTIADRVQAELAKQGKTQPSGDDDVEQTVATMLENDPEFARAVDESDAKAQAKAIARATATAVRAAGAKKTELPEGTATKKDIEESEARIESKREYETHVRSNPQHKALVEHLAKVNGESKVWASTQSRGAEPDRHHAQESRRPAA
jgi:hypothetical protein